MNSNIEYIIGIDPGSVGGISMVDRDFNLVDAMEMPDRKRDIIQFLIRAKYEKKYSCSACIEKAQVMAGMEGKISMQNYMREYGRLLGMLDAIGIAYVEVAPQTWKSRFNLIQRRDPSIPKPTDKKAIAKERTERKKRGKIMAGKIVESLYADMPIHTAEGRLMDGMVESILIAVYGMEREIGHTISAKEWQGKLAL